MDLINTFCEKYSNVPREEVLALVHSFIDHLACMSRPIVSVASAASTPTTDNEYTSLKVAQLKKLCKERGIKTTSSTTKNKLIELLQQPPREDSSSADTAASSAVSEEEKKDEEELPELPELPGVQCNGKTQKGHQCKNSQKTKCPEGSEHFYCVRHIEKWKEYECTEPVAHSSKKKSGAATSAPKKDSSADNEFELDDTIEEEAAVTKRIYQTKKQRKIMDKLKTTRVSGIKMEIDEEERKMNDEKEEEEEEEILLVEEEEEEEEPEPEIEDENPYDGSDYES